MKIIQKFSSHFDERKSPIDMIVFHATATKTLEETLGITLFVRTKEGANPQTALNIGTYVSAAVVIICAFVFSIQSRHKIN